MRRWLPRTVTAQVVALTVASVVLAQAMGFFAFFLHQPALHRSPIEFDSRLSTVTRLVAATPADGRAALVAAVNRSAPDLDIRFEPALPPGEAEHGALAAKLGPGYTAVRSEGRSVVRLPDETVLSAIRPPAAYPPFGPFSFPVAFLAAGLVLLGTWAARTVTLPLRRLAAAVDAGRAEDELNLPADGPTEVRAVAEAVRRRNARIADLLADNARTLAAVGHDLRTPLTRLRLRADLVDDPALRADFVNDLDHMTALTEAALDHLRGQRTPEPRVPADCASLVSTVVDQFGDLGADVTADVPAGITAVIAPNALQRALRNLVENAVRHAGHAVISVTRAEGFVSIAVADRGPGIRIENRDRMTQPFERGDPARSAAPDQGLGLGLSIARAVAEAHGGRLRLTDNHPTGLVAIIDIPDPPRGP